MSVYYDTQKIFVINKMGGGLIQLATKGAQDVYLSGDPDITFFKAVFNKHTNFARENIPVFFDKTFENGTKVTATIGRNADLISKMFLTFKTNEIKTAGGAGRYITDRRYSTYIDYIDILIGGNVIDRQYGDFLDTWHDLTTTDDKMGGKHHNPQRNQVNTNFEEQLRSGTLEMMGNNLGTYNTSNDSTFVITIPLNFWFNKNTGTALPLIALQFHQVTIEVNFKPLLSQDVNRGGNTLGEGTTSDEKLLVDYFYLDSNERKIFSDQQHEYLIEQIQMEDNSTITNTAAGATNVCDFYFNHPVKELIWKLYDSSNNPITRFDFANISLNGTDLTNPHPSYNFSFIEPLKFHTRIPPKGDIFLHSFALKPEDPQPTGSMNFSRIEKANLIVKSENVAINSIIIYGINLNILRIQSGLGALAFS